MPSGPYQCVNACMNTCKQAWCMHSSGKYCAIKWARALTKNDPGRFALLHTLLASTILSFSKHVASCPQVIEVPKQRDLTLCIWASTTFAIHSKVNSPSGELFAEMLFKLAWPATEMVYVHEVAFASTHFHMSSNS